MNKLMLGPLTAVFALLAVPSAKAAEGPWCARVNAGWGVAQEICHFANFEQCRAEATMWGSTAQCTQNPRWLPYWRGRGYEPVYEDGPRIMRKKKRRYR